MIMEVALVFILGLCFGSFTTMASHRLPREEEMVATPSHCPQCNTPLRWKDLFPVFSWLAGKGRCRYCQSKISWRYPLIELACGAIFVWLYLSYGVSWQWGILALFATALLIMLVADLETGLIPDEIHFFLLPLGVGYHWLQKSEPMAVASCAAVGLAIGLLLHYGYFKLRRKHGLGLGDVKFLAVAGIWLGDVHQMVVFIFYSGIIGIAIGLLWRLLARGERFPFGPALAISLFLLVCYPVTGKWFWNGLQHVLVG